MTLPDFLEPLYAAEEMRATDAWAIEQRGIAGVDLMERAGEGVARAVAAHAPDGRIAIVIGKGNNGGDGLVAARLLRLEGREVDVLAVGDPAELRGDAKANLDRLPDPAPEPFAAERLGAAALIVDAVLGTGFSGAVREPARSAIAAMTAAAAPVLAVDVPSGVDASTGAVEDIAVRAEATVTFHAAKPGLWIHPGKAYAGEVEVVDIGIPDGGPGEPRIGLIGDDVLAALPRRGADSTKFASGSVLVCGGSRGLTGAPCLASEAAMRAGAGYVTALVPRALSDVFETRLLEVMTVALPDDDGALRGEGADEVLRRTARADALVLGPGLSRADGPSSLALRVAREARVPMVLDADGLNIHAGRLPDLARREVPSVLTPHAGELGRLLRTDADAVQATRLAHVRRAAELSRAVVVLKGDDTLVASPEAIVGVSRGGSPALATAGTGDVLSGVTAAFLAKGLDPFTAACAAVVAHARAGRIAAEWRAGAEGVIASDVIAALPYALAG